MKLSVCLIVRNEEKTLERILSCINQFADEIIICDTGSTDDTKNIAKKYTNKIFDFVWVDDFAKARNFSFSKASGKYIMWIDADDFITQDNIDKINNLKNNLDDSVNIYMSKYSIAFNEQNEATFSYYRERIVKNCPLNFWQGFVHEAIVLQGKIKYTDIEIEHRKISKGNPKRNLKIYNKKLKNNEIFSARSQYYYAKELFYNGYYKKCITELNKFLKMNDKYYPNILDAIITISKCYSLTNRKEKALSTLLLNIIYINPTSEYLCEIANLFKILGKKDNAIFFYKSALNTKPEYENGSFIKNEYYHYIPLIQLCILLYDKDYNLAKKYHNILKNLYPNDKYVLLNEQFFKA